MNTSEKPSTAPEAESNSNTPIRHVEGQKQEEVRETTVFTADANLALSDPIKPRTFLDTFGDNNTHPNSATIADYLSRPVPFDSGTLLTTDVATTFTSWALPAAALSTTPGTFLSTKTSGFLGLTFDMVIDFILNATPFQQGRYMVCWVPTGGARNVAKTQAFRDAHLSTLTQRTQTKRIEVDVNKDTHGRLTIPWDSCLEYFPLASFTDADAFGNLGHLRIFPYSPLVDPSGGGAVSYRLYCSFHNVKMVGAAVPQSNRTGSKSGMLASQFEAKSVGQGPISSMSKKIAAAAKELAPIPGIGAFASTASWAANIASGVASVFGWSKPANLGPNTRVTQGSAYYIGNTDGIDQGILCSLMADNCIAPLPGFASSDIDEMAFANFASIPAWFKTFTATTSDAAGTLLTSIQVRPNISLITATVTGKTVYHHTPISYLASHFRAWRGSMTFSFKVVKTSFHSMRIRAAFFPVEIKSAISAASYANLPLVHSDVIDLREVNEFKITIPFLNSSSFLDPNEYTGLLNIYVVDALVATGTVSNTITFLVEHSAGPDFEVAIPAESVNDTAVYGITPQSNVDELMDKTIGTTTVFPDLTTRALHCIGEKCLSWRTFLKAYAPMTCTDTRAAAAVEFVLPALLPAAWYTGAAWQLPVSEPTMLDTVSQFYTYNRGSYRVKKQVTSSQDVVMTTQYQVPYAAAGTAINVLRGVTGYNGENVGIFNFTHGKFVTTQTEREKYVETGLAMYNHRHSRLTADSFAAGSTHTYTFAIDVLASNNVLMSISVTGVATFNNVTSLNYKAAGDDFDLGGFISIPPMLISNLSGKW